MIFKTFFKEGFGRVELGEELNEVWVNVGFVQMGGKGKWGIRVKGG